jgi:hypothetical protein
MTKVPHYSFMNSYAAIIKHKQLSRFLFHSRTVKSDRVKSDCLATCQKHHKCTAVFVKSVAADVEMVKCDYLMNRPGLYARKECRKENGQRKCIFTFDIATLQYARPNP